MWSVIPEIDAGGIRRKRKRGGIAVITGRIGLYPVCRQIFSYGVRPPDEGLEMIISVRVGLGGFLSCASEEEGPSG